MRWPLISTDPTVRGAQLRRNGRADRGRARRWIPARDAAWALIDDAVAVGARVAVVGAGNGDDLPLTRLVQRAAQVDLIDVDAGAAAGAIRREARTLRRRLRVIEADVTGGAADAIVSAAVRGTLPPPRPVPTSPVGDGGYDLVIADLLYTQLLYPALLDAGIDAEDRARVLDGFGPGLTAGVVARLHASTSRPGAVAHLHDVAGWWDGRTQPATIAAVLAAGPDELQRWGLVEPRGCDPAPAIERLGLRPRRRAVWRWPFTDGVDYVVRGWLV
jgi:hypothetical protein